MRILLIISILLLSVSACDRSKGKGSDIEWQQRQELQRQEEQRQEEQYDRARAFEKFEENKIENGGRILER